MTTANAPSTEVVAPAVPEIDAEEAAWNAEVARREGGLDEPDDDPDPPAAATPTPEPQPSAGVPASTEPTIDELLSDVPDARRATVKAMLDKQQQERERLAAERQELDHKFRSAQGRIAALERKGAAPAAAQQSATKEPDAAELQRRKQFREDYPDVAQEVEALEKRIEKLAAQAVVPPDILEFLNEQRNRAVINQKVDAVATVHKDFTDIVRNPLFDTWANQQSEYVKTLIASDNPEQVIVAVDLFKAANPQLRTSPSPSAKAGAVNPVAETPEQAALRRRREAQARSVELPANGGTLPQQLDATSEDALWQQAAREADKRLARR